MSEYDFNYVKVWLYYVKLWLQRQQLTDED